MVKMSKEILEEYKTSLDSIASTPEFNTFIKLPENKRNELICLWKQKIVKDDLLLSHFVYLLEILGANFYFQGYSQTAIICHQLQILIDPNHSSTRRLKRIVKQTFFSRLFKRFLFFLKTSSENT